MSQTGDHYTRETDGQQSSHDYDSIHMSMIANNRAMLSPSELEKGGRYIHVGRQDQEHSNKYAEVGNTAQNIHQLMAVTDALTHGYDVPKPVGGATQPSQWDGVQSYETPESVVTFSSNKTAVGFTNTNQGQASASMVGAPAPVQDAYDLPQPISRKSYENLTDKSATLGRKVSDNSTLSFNSAGEKFSAQSVSKHRSCDHLQKSPSDEFPEYENIKKGGFLPGRILSGQPISTPYNNPAPIPKPRPPVKVQLKKPALPSKLFKPTAELSQILDSNNTGKEQKSRYQPLTPVGIETKPAYEQAKKSTRSQTWTLDRNVDSKLPRTGNYTPIDLDKMDPNSDYQQM